MVEKKLSSFTHPHVVPKVSFFLLDISLLDFKELW